MILTLSPTLMTSPMTASVAGDVLTLNGEALDFGPLPAGATLPRAAIDNPWIAGDVMRDLAGVLTVPLILPHGSNAPEETRFPAPIRAGDGPVDLPPYGDPPAAPPATAEVSVSGGGFQVRMSSDGQNWSDADVY